MPQGSLWMCGIGLRGHLSARERSIISADFGGQRVRCFVGKWLEKRNATYQIKPIASSSGERSGMK